jgi:hypothetical protein
MVFASRRTCIEANLIGWLLREDGYRPIPNGVRDAALGDLVVYKFAAAGEIGHVGVLALKKPDLTQGTWDVEILSQWGWDGEYFHRPDDVPKDSFGAHIEFWTERVNL